MFTHVNPIYLDVIWPKVEALLASAIEKGYGEASLDQLKLLVRRGESHLAIWHENDEIISAGVIDFINYPNYRVAHAGYLSGRHTEESFTALKAWCCDVMGAKKLQCLGSDAITRLYARYGMEKKYNLLRIDL